MKALSAPFRLALSLVASLAWSGVTFAQPDYGVTDFEATGSAEARPAFTRGLLQLHNFEYEDARASFLEAQRIDPDFYLAYWGEALTHEHPLWNQYDTEASRAALAKLGATADERVAKAPTEREGAYMHAVNVLFGEGNQLEREVRYSEALAELSEQYPDDLDAAALHALSLLTTSHHGGREFSVFMRAGAITEEILDQNPRHPGALHYNIHSFDDPIHAPLGLRAADAYAEVAPSAVHALHMGSHIYFALGMWEEGSERNLRSFEESVARQPDPDGPFGPQGYHALTWLIYSLAQQGKHAESAAKLALIEDQVNRFGDAMHRQNFIASRASYIVDTLDFDSRFADIEIEHSGLAPFFVATDHYVTGIVALDRGDVAAAKAALAAIDAASAPDSLDRRVMAPHLLHLTLAGQIALAEDHTEQALELIGRATDIEAGLAPDYGPAIPVQPSAELLADTYLALGDRERAADSYRLALSGFVGRSRSLHGLARATGEPHAN